MDIIYPYKRSPGDLELRYSLRSLVNVPHDRVIIAGDVPSGVSDAVTTVRVPRYDSDRYVSSTSNIFAAIRQADVSDDFIVMNDDIFVLKPWTFHQEHKSRLDEALANPAIKGDYRARIVSTAGLLRSVGIHEPLFYGLHTPTIYSRSRLIDMMRDFPMPRCKYLMRTMYHNLYPQPSIQRTDVKVKVWTEESEAGDILSISDGVARLPLFQEWLNRQFPVASVYEVL